MIKEFLQEHGEYHDDKSFKDLTTLKMGGPIAHFVMPNNVDDLNIIVNYLKTNKILFKIIGNGSNLVCGESEYDGVVISLKKLDSYEIDNDELYVEAGVLVPMMANYLAKEGYSALEFAAGIPGCIGGLVYMNAGAYKGSMSDVVKEVLVLKDGHLIVNCILDKIYSKTESGKKIYYIKLQEQEVLLKEYIKKANTTTVNVGE